MTRATAPKGKQAAASRAPVSEGQGAALMQVRTIGAGVVTVLAAALAYAATVFCGAEWGWVFGALAIGALMASALRTWQRAAVVSAASCAVGGVLAVIGYPTASVGARASSLNPYVRDQIGTLANQYLWGMLRANAVNTNGWLTAVFLGTLLAAATAAGLGHAIRSSSRPKVMRIVSASVATALAIVVLWTGAMLAENRAFFVHGLNPGYSVDGAIYWRTLDFMRTGDAYYPALVRASQDDLRVRGQIRGGKFAKGWIDSAASMRMPYVYDVLAALSPSGTVGVLVVATAFASILLAGAFVALLPRVGPAAAFAPLLLVPYLQASLGGGGFFLVDYWAGIFAALAILAWTRQRYLLAGALALCAGVSRETAALLLLCFLLWALYRVVRGEREWRPRAAAFAAGLGIFAVAYAVHILAANGFIASTGTATGTVWVELAHSAVKPFAEKFLAPADFSGLVYGLVFFPPVLFLLLQFPGWFAALGRDWDALAPILAYAVVWIVFTAGIGATSSYWGQLYMPVAIVGTGCLAAWATVTSQARGAAAATNLGR